MSAGPRLFLGVDGGQSHSLAVLADDRGRLLGLGRGGACNHFDEPGGPARFETTLRQVISAAFAEAGLPVQPLAAAGLGLTGAWEHAPAVVAGIVPVGHLVAVEDTVTAWVGALAGQPGLVVIGGTGSVAYGRDERGQTARAGGWGYWLGDEGSGFDLGRQALRAAAQASDGRGPATRLQAHIPAHFGLPDLPAVAAALYAGRLNRADVAGLARLVVQTAAEPDPVARALVAAAGTALADLAVAVARRLAWPAPPVSPVGGLFAAGELLRQPFTTRLQAELPGASLRPARYPPVLGGLLLAWQAAGLPLTPSRLARLGEAIETVDWRK